MNKQSFNFFIFSIIFTLSILWLTFERNAFAKINSLDKKIIDKAYIGISYQDLNEKSLSNYKSQCKIGVYVNKVILGSPASVCGLSQNDVITKMDNSKIDSMATFQKVISKYLPGENVNIELCRKGIKNTVSLKFGSFLNRLTESETNLEILLNNCVSMQGKNNETYLNLLKETGLIYLKNNRVNKSVKVFEEVEKISRDLFGNKDQKYLRAKEHLMLVSFLDKNIFNDNNEYKKKSLKAILEKYNKIENIMKAYDSYDYFTPKLYFSKLSNIDIFIANDNPDDINGLIKKYMYYKEKNKKILAEEQLLIASDIALKKFGETSEEFIEVNMHLMDYYIFYKNQLKFLYLLDSIYELNKNITNFDEKMENLRRLSLKCFSFNESKRKGAKIFWEMIELSEYKNGKDSVEHALLISKAVDKYIALDNAEKILKKAKKIFENNELTESNDYIKVLVCLSYVYRYTGASNDIVCLENNPGFLIQKCINIIKKNKGIYNYDYISKMFDLLLYYAGKSRTGKVLTGGMDNRNIQIISQNFSYDHVFVQACSIIYQHISELCISLYNEKDPFIISQWIGYANIFNLNNSNSIIFELADIRKRLYGEDSPWYAPSMLDFAQLDFQEYYKTHDEKYLNSADEYLNYYIDIMKKNYGELSINYINALNIKANYFMNIDNKKAKEITELISEVSEKRQKININQDLWLTEKTANNFITAEHNYLKAIELYKDVISKKEKKYGKNDNRTLQTYNILASLYNTLCEYGNALEMYKVLSHNENYKYQATRNLLSIYIELGDMKNADTYANLLKEELNELNKNKMSLEFSTIQESLASYYLNINENKLAFQYYKDSLETLKYSFNELDIEGTPKFGTDKIFGMGKAYFKMGKYNKAEELMKKAINSEKNPGEGVSVYYNIETDTNHALHLLDLAKLYQKKSKFEDSKRLFSEVIKILKNSLSEKHPDYANALMDRSLLFIQMGKYDKAFEDQKAALITLGHHIERISMWASEKRLHNYLSKFEEWYDYFYSLILNDNLKNKIAEDALTLHLVYKGRILEVLSTRHRLSLLSENTETYKLIDMLRNTIKKLVHFTICPPKNWEEKKITDYLSQLNIQKQKLEEKISLISIKHKKQFIGNNITTNKLANFLKTGDVYLDYISYVKYDYNEEKFTDKSYYLGFSLTKNEDNKYTVHLIDIGFAKSVNDYIKKIRVLINNQKLLNNKISTATKSKNTAKSNNKEEILSISNELYQQLISPFKITLDKTNNFYVSASNNLYLLPFEILTTPDKNYLCDKVTVIYNLGRDLVTSKMSINTIKSDQYCIMANPDYSKMENKSNKITKNSEMRIAPMERGFISGWPIKFENLPGTLEEAKAIKEIVSKKNLAVTVFTNEQATENRIKNQFPPLCLHLATHGFFIEDIPPVNIRKSHRGVGGVTQVDYSKPKAINPLLRSGLALCGANNLAENYNIQELEEDGILTAAEVTGINLLGSDLVVLSACNTGIGVTQRGEGVAGLRRAFKIAGANNIIMSLWNIPDKETVWLMKNFYNEYLSKKRPATALNDAKTKFREYLKELYGNDFLFYWAAFIIEGY